MQNIKMKINLVAVVAAIGAIIALAGAIIAWRDFPNVVNTMFLVFFAVAVLGSILNIKPDVDIKVPVINLLLGIVILVDSLVVYVYIVESMTNAISPDAVGIGPWMALTGSVIYIIFTASDLIFKMRAKA